MSTETYKLIYALVVGTIVIGSILGYFLFSMIRMHRSFVHQTDLQNQSKILALENERKLIAADLHDDIGPVLSAINIKLQEVNPAEARQKILLKEAIGHVNGIFSRMRQISLMLVPRFLESRGPLYAIEEFIADYTHNSTIDIKVKPISTPGLSEEKALHVFRMLQEIVHNAIRHSNAKKLRISAEMTDTKLVLKTSEDGIGFNVNAMRKSKGLGLQNLELRARMVGGRLVTDSEKGRGTRYTIEIPITD